MDFEDLCLPGKIAISFGWMVCVCVWLFALSGCGTKTIVQRPGTVGVVSAPAKSVHVLLPDATGRPVEQVIDLAPGDEIKTQGPK